jgi:hypothetical protein
VSDIRLQFAVHLQVAEDERLRIGATFERDAGAVANAAVGAVAADQVARVQPLRRFVAMPQGAADSVLAGLELDELDAPLDVDALLGQVLVQDRLGLGLGNEEQEREGRIFEADVEKPDHDNALAGVELQLRRVVAALDQRRRDPEPPQNLERARLHRERTRFMHAIELPVDDPDAGAECVQLGGKRESGRSRADDEHVRFAVCRHRTRIFHPRAGQALGGCVRVRVMIARESERSTASA